MTKFKKRSLIIAIILTIICIIGFTCYFFVSDTDIYIEYKNGQILKITNGGINACPRLSNNNKLIVYHSFIPNKDGSKITIYDINSKKQNCIIKSNNFNSMPSLSTDNSLLAYRSRNKDKTDLFIYNFNNKETYQITNDQIEEEDPIVSPDGKYIAYMHENALFIVDIKNKKITQLTNSGGIFSMAEDPVWSIDSQLIAYGSTFAIAIVSIDDKINVLSSSDQLKGYYHFKNVLFHPKDKNQLIFIAKEEKSNNENLYIYSIINKKLNVYKKLESFSGKHHFNISSDESFIVYDK